MVKSITTLGLPQTFVIFALISDFTDKILRETNLLQQLIWRKMVKNIATSGLLQTFVIYTLTVWKLRNFTAVKVFSQKFRQINVLLKNFTIRLIWRKKICKAENFSFFHTVAVAQYGNYQTFCNHFEINYVESTLTIFSNYCSNSS